MRTRTEARRRLPKRALRKLRCAGPRRKSGSTETWSFRRNGDGSGGSTSRGHRELRIRFRREMSWAGTRTAPVRDRRAATSSRECPLPRSTATKRRARRAQPLQDSTPGWHQAHRRETRDCRFQRLRRAVRNLSAGPLWLEYWWRLRSAFASQ